MLDRFQWLSIDFLLDGTEAVKLVLELKEGEEGPAFRVTFGLLNQCQARLRLPLSATDQNRWMLPREAALLKPLCGGAKVNLDRVDRLRLAVEAKGDAPVRWCMTPMMASVEEPSRIDYPRLPAGKLVDDLGQWTLKSWKGKRRSRQEVRAGLARQHTAADDAAWPAEFSRWGGDSRVQFAATGFFHTHHDGKRWWLVDPDGHSFWSAGPDCVRSSMGMHVKGLKSALSDPAVASNGGADYLQANFRDAFGEQWHSRWVEITLAFLKSTGFNTVANWSEWEVASRAGFPYVRPLSWQGEVKTARVFRDMPDVFHPDFESDVDAFARQLASTRDDPAMIGYFLMNEPTWGFASQTPAEGMLYATTECVSRREFANWLRHKYSDSRGLASAWGAPVAVESVESGQWNERTPPGAAPDLEAFSTVMVERLFGSLTRACRAVDPHHLNLGARYHIIPPKWALDGLGGFDIFSINCYNTKVRRDLGEVCQRIGRPAMVGEWHFGAHDAGLPASGIGRVADQTARGQAYRVYLEDAAALPWCVGAHWFTLYDQAVLGRGDGENYQIGFLDVCNQPYEEITTAARRSHERLYDLAWGRSEPFSQEPEYLPRLFY
ncbi:MAG: hypothetical protein EA425_11720 [Puniceicoccaceae bacterium]|nr:MAG: hypothetical protein EA425_11720 [Puniceicoccaceae bacterium]